MANAIDGASEIVVMARPERVWAILEDSSYLTHWATMVKSTTGTKEATGTMRSCEVEWEGRKDHVVERCIEADSPRRIVWEMEEGMMTKMFSTIRFGFDLEDRDGPATRLRMWFLYQPRHIFARLMYHLMMKKKMASLRAALLENLKRMAEQA